MRKSMVALLVSAALVIVGCGDDGGGGGAPPPDDSRGPDNTLAEADAQGDFPELTSFPGISWDDDYFRIYVPPGFEQVDVQLMFAHALGDLDLELYDSSGMILTFSESTTDDESISFQVAPGGGTYYILVYPFGAPTGNTYTLFWDATAPGDDSNESDNTLAEADAQGDFPELTSFPGVSWDDDFFRINVPPGFERVDVQLMFAHALGDLDLALYDSSGMILAFSDSTSDDESISFLVAPGGGTYYILVYPFGPPTGNTYTLSWDALMPNVAPTATSAAITTDEDTTSAGVTPAVTDADVGDTHTFTIVTQPANGTASISGNLLVYTPNADYNGADSFTYRATDSGALFINGTAAITVNSVNDAPTVTTATITTDEDTASAGVTPAVTDVDDSSFTFTIQVQPANGTASIVGNQLVYTPNADYNGADSFTYRATDSGALFVNGTATVTVISINDAPTATSATKTTNEDAVDVSVNPTFTDVDDSLYTLTILTQPANGTASVLGNRFLYTPSADYNGADSFTYRATDSGALFVDGTATITVNAVNDSPTATSATITTNEDTASAGVTPAVTDVDIGDSFTFSIVTFPTNGSAGIVGNQLVYTPNADYNGADSFTYRATDSGALWINGTASVTVNSVEDVPVIGGTPATAVDSDSLYSFTPTASDGDSGDTLTFSILNTPSWATFNTTNGSLSGTPNNDDAGNVSTTYSGIVISVTDTKATVDLATFAITVNDVTAPTFVTNLTWTIQSQQITFTWDDATASATDFAGMLVLRRDDGQFPTGPNDVSATAVVAGNTGLVDSGLTDGILYYYTIWTMDEVPNYSGGIQRSLQPLGGYPDPTFGSNGLVSFDSGAGDTVRAIIADPSDNMLVAGSKLWKFTVDGALDSGAGGFGPGGPDGFVDLGGTGYAVAFDGNGKIVVAGSSGGNLTVWRFSSDGIADTTFGTSGIATVASAVAHTLDFDASGNILV